jgi:hypothetical protein
MQTFQCSLFRFANDQSGQDLIVLGIIGKMASQF